ncbi:MAG TPA: hypothetical protein VIO38_07940, partial [Rariglobus sp.]
MSTVVASLVPFVPSSSRASSVPPASSERARAAVVWRNWLPGVLARQCLAGGANDGAFAQDETGWYCGRHTAY